MRPTWYKALPIGLLTLASVAHAQPASRPAGPAARAASGMAEPVKPRPVISLAAARKAKALQLLGEGQRLLKQYKFAQALDRFERAYKAYPGRKLHYWIAWTNHKLTRILPALKHYELFLKKHKRAEDPRNWDQVNKLVFALQGKIATVTFMVNIGGAKVLINGKPYGTTPLLGTRRFMPGGMTVVISKPGYEDETRNIVLKKGKSHPIRVKLLTTDAALAKRKKVQRLAEEKRQATLKLKREREERIRKALRRQRTLRVSGWATLGTGGALLVAAGVMAILSAVEAKNVEGKPYSTPWDEARPAYDRNKTYIAAGYGLLGVGLAVAATGAALVLFSYRKTEAPGARPKKTTPSASSKVLLVPNLGPGQAGMTLRLTF